MKVYYRVNDMYDDCKSNEYETKILLRFHDGQNKNKFTRFDKDINLQDNINKLKTANKYCAFEIMKKGISRKPYLDVERVYPDKASMSLERKTFITKLLTDIIRLFKKEYGYVLIRDDIKITESSGPVDGGYKLSFHVVVAPDNLSYYYTANRDTTSSTLHFCATLVKMDPVYEKFLDKGVYGTEQSMRIIGSYKKFNENRVFVPISSTTFKPIEVKPKAWARYFITYTTGDLIQLHTPLIEQSTRTKNQMSQNVPTKTYCNGHLLNLVKRHHASAYSTGCNGVYNFNYKNRNEPCPLTGKIHLGTNGFYVTEWSGGYHLRCHSAHCQGKFKHIGYVDETDEFINNATQVKTQYLSEDPTVIETVDRFIENQKVLAIKSFMGTGKTVLVNQILGKLNNLEKQKVLWITHRQTLTKAIFGAFKQFGFKNYMDEEGCLFDHNRVIVQIDSLLRLLKETDREGESTFKKYDLVIIDEVEGALSHFSSPYLNKNGRDARSIFDQMTDIIDSSSKLLLLDADLHTRTRLLMERYSDMGVKFIHNKYVPETKTLELTNCEKKFLERLYDDVEKGLKICVVSMSSDRITAIYDELVKRKVKCILHTSKTDDSLKTELENVNSFWTKFQILLFSPTIESGIDFNVKYFDKIYGVIQDGFKTCSQRSFLQQLGRIRHCPEKNIYCLYNGLRNISGKDDTLVFGLDSDIYTFNDVLGYVKNYETLNGKKILRSRYILKDNGDCVVKTLVVDDLQLFDQICLHNEVEELNKHPHTFLTVLNRLAMRANIILKFDYVEKVKKVITREAKKKAIDRLVSANIDGYDIDSLKKRQAKGGLTANEKTILEKLYFIKTFKIQDYKDENKFRKDLEDLYGKESVLYRYRLLFGYKDIYSDEFDNIRDGSEKARIKIVTDMVNLILDKNYEKLRPEYLNDLTLSKKQYLDAIDRVSKNSLYFKSENMYRPLFFDAKKKNNNNQKDCNIYLNIISDILCRYNIQFKRGNRIRIPTVKENNITIQPSTLEYIYCLSVGGQIKSICMNGY